MAAAQPAKIGRYILEKKIGSGGMAVVYRAFDPVLKRTVAVKLIRKEAFAGKNPEILKERFRREAKALARLDHPNIVKVLDYGEYNGMNYLVMEFLEGMTLKEVKKPVSVDQAIRLIRPVLKALNYVHRQGILHRDIKPSNIMFSKDRTIKLTDFGIAKWLEPTATMETLTRTGLGIGTPEYMAPEQGLGKKTDERADLYSLGIVFYELVTGEKPFQGATPMAILAKQATEPIPDPRKFVPGLDKSVVLFLARALAKKPEDRFATLGEFLRELDGLRGRSGEPTGTAPVSNQNRRRTISEAEIRRALTLSGGRPAAPAENSVSRWMRGIIVACVGLLIFLILELNQNTSESARKLGEAEETGAAIYAMSTEFAKTVSVFNLASANLATAIAGASAADRQRLESLAETYAFLEQQSAQIQTAAALITLISNTQIPQATRQAFAATATAFQADIQKSPSVRTENESVLATIRAENEIGHGTVPNDQSEEPEPVVIVYDPTSIPEPIRTPTQAEGWIFENTATSIASPQPIPTVMTADLFTGVAVGDPVSFGRYEQDNNFSNGSEAIEWKVLSVTADSVLLISRDQLDIMPYHERDEDVTWATSTLRRWLNQDFFNRAFTESEKSVILYSKLENPDNRETGVDGGADTEDSVFLLSADEVERYLPDMTLFESGLSDYAYDQFKDIFIGADFVSGWWTRTPGRDRKSTAWVVPRLGGAGMQVDRYGFYSDYANGRVRPAIWVKKNGGSSPSTAAQRLPVGDGIRPDHVYLPGYGHGKLPEDDVVSPYANFSPGDIAYIGMYTTDDFGAGRGLLEWDVLEVRGREALIVLSYGLDGFPYHADGGAATWATSSIRSWLNGEFYANAFDAEEKSHILASEIVNTGNPENGNEGGANTSDNVFLLSYSEAIKYFRNAQDRILSPSVYAVTQKVWLNPATAGTNWWLRTPGFTPNSAMYIDDQGNFNMVGALNDSPKGTIRPAMWVRFGN